MLVGVGVTLYKEYKCGDGWQNVWDIGVNKWGLGYIVQEL